MGFLDRFRRDEPASAPVVRPEPAAPLLPSPPADRPSRDEQLEWLEESARELAAPAFLSAAGARERLLEQYVLDDDLDLVEADVAGVAERVWAERRAEEAGWVDEGDYPAVVAAFAALETSGVVARMNFACCQNCGHAEIGDERRRDSRGYTFFHEQDGERLAPGGSDLYLAFGVFDVEPGTEPAVVVQAEERVGAEVAAALRDQGLTVEWDGTCAQRIRVLDLDWRKRLPVD